MQCVWFEILLSKGERVFILEKGDQGDPDVCPLMYMRVLELYHKMHLPWMYFSASLPCGLQAGLAENVHNKNGA